MKTSEKGIAFIAAHEGVVTKAYKDSVGVYTIGIGHTASAGAPRPVAGMRITRAEALAIFARDLVKFEKRVTKAMLGVSQQHAYDAGVSFDFNTGAIHKASWVAAYLAGRLEEARTRFLSWNKPAVIKGRRKDEARLLIDGIYGPLIDVTMPPPVNANPAESAHPSDVMVYQEQLAKLGYYKGPLDGTPGPLTKAAVLAYQKGHPDLVADGIVGPATRTSLARDIAAKSAPPKAAGVGAAVALAAGTAAASTGHPWLWIAVGAGALAAVGIGFVLVKQRLSR